MRKIKFRNWAGNQKKMYYSDDFSFEFLENSCYVLLNGEVVGDTDWKKPMQFTGLKDRNGKEIYEGDIVEWDSLLMDGITTEKRRVEIRYLAKYHEYLPNDQSRGVNVLFTFPRTSNAQTIEVIGNIHENSELLKSL